MRFKQFSNGRIGSVCKKKVKKEERFDSVRGTDSDPRNKNVLCLLRLLLTFSIVSHRIVLSRSAQTSGIGHYVPKGKFPTKMV